MNKLIVNVIRALIAVIVVPVVVLLTPISASAATEWWCGPLCDGKSPSYVVPEIGKACTTTTTTVATGHPKATYLKPVNGKAVSTTETDTSTTIAMRYSSKCQ